MGFQVVGGRRVASNFFWNSGLSKEEVLAFCWFRGATFERTEEEEESRRQASSPGTRECTRCLQWWRHCSHVLCCASAMIWLSKSTSKSPSSLSLAPVEVTALVGGWTAPACLCRGAARAAGAATSVGGHSYSVQSASEVLTIARSGGGALNARIEASVRRDEAGGRRCLLAAACVSGRFSGVQIRALEPRTTRIHRQPRVTRVEAFGASEEVPFQLFGSSVWQDFRARVTSLFSGRRAHRPGAPAGATLGAMLRALASGSTRAIAATGAVATYLCSAAAATEAGPSTSSDDRGADHDRRRQPPRGDAARCAHCRGVSDRGEQGHRSVEGVHRHRQGSIVQGRARRGGEVPATRAQGGAGGIRQGRPPRRRRS